MAEYAAQGGYKTITMALKPKEAHLTLYATQMGKLNLLLRSPLDSKKVRATDPITMDKLWATLFNVSAEQQAAADAAAAKQRAAAEAAAVQNAPEPEIQIYSGGRQN